MSSDKKNTYMVTLDIYMESKDGLGAIRSIQRAMKKSKSYIDLEVASTVKNNERQMKAIQTLIGHEIIQ